MLTDKDVKVVGLFLESLKIGINHNFIVSDLVHLPLNKKGGQVTLVPLELFGLIKGFAIAELSVNPLATVGNRSFRQDSRLTQSICEAVMNECEKRPLLKYQYVIPAHVFRYEDFVFHLRRYEHCVKFGQQLPIGKLTFYADSIDRLLETPDKADATYSTHLNMSQSAAL